MAGSCSSLPRSAPSPLLVSLVLALAAWAWPVHGQEPPGENQQVDPALFQELDWRSVGPSRGGRVTAVAGHRSHPHTFYMGSTGGGVWRTTDHGRSWRNISDGDFEATSSIGAIQVADSDPSVIYVGTGSDGIRSNVITGRGIYKSTNSGETWRHMGLREVGQIGAVEVHPEDPDRVFVAALGHPFGENPERGVYRSVNGGESWEKVLFASDSVGAIDLEMAPDDPSTLYAALWRGERKPWTIISGCATGECADGIWKSTDGGDTWRKVPEGLPSGLVGKIDLAVTPADPDRVYAVVEAPEPSEGLYRSDDRGDTWRLVNDREGLMARPFYYTNVSADPVDPDVVYVNNEGFYKSEDGGVTFQRRPTPHGDNHDMWINPDDPDIFIQSNDGGANVTLDGGRTWSTQLNQPTAELYQVDVDDRFPYWLYAGQQDNSTIAVPSRPPAEPAPAGPDGWWKAVGGCETGPVVPKPGSDPLVVYANCKGRFGRFHMRTGQEQNYWVGGQYMYGTNPADLKYRFQRTVPIEISPHDPNVVYHGSQYVHRSRTGGQTWEQISPDLTAFPPEHQVLSGEPITRDITGEEHFSALYVIEESPHQRGEIWAGSNDGPVHVTLDGGETWTDVTPEEWGEDGRINAIEISPNDPDRVFVAGYRYLLDDWEPYVFMTTDHGQTWTRITTGENGIPADHPVRVVREDPARAGLLYAGTEFGLYASFDYGAHWQPLQLDLPVTPITDIEVHRNDLVISTMGRGFWILDDLTPLHEADAELASSRAHLFEPRDVHRVRYDPTPGGDRAPHLPEYPGPGLAIDYYLGPDAEGPVTLEIRDNEGNLVRGFSSAPGGYPYPTEQETRSPHVEREGEPRLATGPGHHRVRWDLRHPGPWSPEDDSRAGPMAVPGSYRVTLTVGDREQTHPFRIKIDPRIRASGTTVSDLREQLELNLDVRNLLGEARRAAARAESLLQEAPGGGRQARRNRSALTEIRAELVTDPQDTVSSYPRPMLIGQIEYLYGMTTAADQEPGEDARTRYATLRERLDGIQEQLRSVAESVGGGGGPDR